MGKFTADQSMSLDGFTAGPNVGVGNPLGDGGERLHAWMFRGQGATGRNAEVRDELFRTSGALVMGRRMFDLGEELWGNDPPFHLPVFVVTHDARDPLVKAGGTTYTFVVDGIELESTRVIDAPGVTHLTFRLAKKAGGGRGRGDA